VSFSEISDDLDSKSFMPKFDLNWDIIGDMLRHILPGSWKNKKYASFGNYFSKKLTSN
jgi:hypothetical protein